VDREIDILHRRLTELENANFGLRAAFDKLKLATTGELNESVGKLPVMVKLLEEHCKLSVDLGSFSRTVRCYEKDISAFQFEVRKLKDWQERVRKAVNS
jgi:hypothetical protein